MNLDAIIISSYDIMSFSKTSHFRLSMDGEIATIQKIKSLIHKDRPSGCVHRLLNWHDAPKLNGIVLYDYLVSKGLRCKLIDHYLLEKEQVQKYMGYKPKYATISTTFITNKIQLAALVKQIRELCSDITIIAGGPFVFSSYRLLKKMDDPVYDTESAKKDYLFLESETDPRVDYYIVGSHGLAELSRLIEHINTGRPISDIANIAQYKENQYHFTPAQGSDRCQRFKIHWQDLPAKIYQNKVINLQASNGCPFKCRFCNFVKDPRLTFVRPVDEIVADMLLMQKLGFKYIRFADDNFRFGKPLHGFCNAVIKSGLSIKWTSLMRLQNLEGVDLKQLRRSGCVEVQIGLESAHPEILKAMNKRADPARYYGLIKDLLYAGINVLAFFIIGFPGETRETAKVTIDFIKSIDFKDAEGIFSWNMFPFTLAPLSNIYEPGERKKCGLEGYMRSWRHDTMESNEASEIISQAYLEIDNAGVYYSGDNLDSLFGLRPDSRKKFISARHQLSKLALKKEIGADDCFKYFDGLFQ